MISSKGLILKRLVFLHQELKVEIKYRKVQQEQEHHWRTALQISNNLLSKRITTKEKPNNLLIAIVQHKIHCHINQLKSYEEINHTHSHFNIF
jgi:hypothetical protein